MKLGPTYTTGSARDTFGDRWNFGVINSMQRWNEMILQWCATCAASHVSATQTLASDHIALVVQRTTGITIALRTAIIAVRQAIRLGQTLIAILSSYQALTSTFASVHVAAGIVVRTENVTRTQLTTFRIAGTQIPEAIFAEIALTSFDIWFTMTGASFNCILCIAD